MQEASQQAKIRQTLPAGDLITTSSSGRLDEQPSSIDNNSGILSTDKAPQGVEAVHEEQPSDLEEQVKVEMEFALPPPNRVAAGSRLATPIVILFKATKRKSTISRPAAQQQNFGGIWAYLSLMDAVSKTSLAPPRTDLLLGQPVASIHNLPNRMDDDDTSFAYTKFPGLTITTPGRYCFRINVIDMSAQMGSTARLLPALHSGIFDVVDLVELDRGTSPTGEGPEPGSDHKVALRRVSDEGDPDIEAAVERLMKLGVII